MNAHQRLNLADSCRINANVRVCGRFETCRGRRKSRGHCARAASLQNSVLGVFRKKPGVENAAVFAMGEQKARRHVDRAFAMLDEIREFRLSVSARLPSCGPCVTKTEKMTDLHAHLNDPDIREKFIVACCELVEREVSNRRGFSGAAVKAGFRVTQKVRPNLVKEVVTGLMPEFARALQPWFERAMTTSEQGGPGAAFRSALEQEPAAVADALLHVTDAKIDGASEIVRKTYAHMRKNARDQVCAAVPGLAQTMEPFVRQAAC